MVNCVAYNSKYLREKALPKNKCAQQLKPSNVQHSELTNTMHCTLNQTCNRAIAFLQ